MSFYAENRPKQNAFYKSVEWQACRKAYFKHAKGLCEVCLAKGLIKQGEIVHHVIEMNEERIDNPKLAYGFDNLQLVCRECHAKIHEKKRSKAGRSQRYEIDKQGKVIVKG